MELNVIRSDGRMVLGTTREQALAAGESEAEIAAAEEVLAQTKARTDVRARIHSSAGDIPSLLGTASDVASIGVVVGACVVAALEEETDYADFRTLALDALQAVSGDHDPILIAKAFLADVAAGTLRIPALEKGITVVLAEVNTRGNAVAEALNPIGDD